MCKEQRCCYINSHRVSIALYHIILIIQLNISTSHIIHEHIFSCHFPVLKTHKFSSALQKFFMKFYTFFIAFSIKILHNTCGRFQRGLKKEFRYPPIQMLQGLQNGACFVAVRNLGNGFRNLCSVERLLLLGMNTEKHIQRKSHPACRMAFFIVFLIYLSR